MEILKISSRFINSECVNASGRSRAASSDHINCLSIRTTKIQIGRIGKGKINRLKNLSSGRYLDNLTTAITRHVKIASNVGSHSINVDVSRPKCSKINQKSLVTDITRRRKVPLPNLVEYRASVFVSGFADKQDRIIRTNRDAIGPTH